MLITSRGQTKIVEYTVGRVIYARDMRDGMPYGKVKKLSKEWFDKWANHLHKHADHFDGKKIKWGRVKAQ